MEQELNGILGCNWSVEKAFSHLPLVITNRSGKLIDSTEENLLIRKFCDHFNSHFNIN
jgi:peptide methionine sulfoxide reductase MsrA